MEKSGQSIPGSGNDSGDQQEPYPDSGLLSPIERVSEILFGLLMALTYTCTFKVARADRAQVDDMLYAALGCNVVWGLVDGVFYIVMGMTDKGHGLRIIRYVKHSKNPARARKYIADELPKIIANQTSEDELEIIRKKIVSMAKLPGKVKMTLDDLKAGGTIFLLVFLSTLPVAVPFLLMKDDRLALRVSNGVAILMMFACGWVLGRYASRNPWRSGLVMSALGIGLVLLAIKLGG